MPTRPARRPAAPSLTNLPACVEDARKAALQRMDGPPDPTGYRALLERLGKARARIPPLYLRATFEPFVRTLEGLGAKGFAEVLEMDRERVGAARLMLDIAQAILQNGERYEDRATDAFQEVVSDLYDGFLSAEDRRGVKPPDRGVVPPLVKWGSAAEGPYTWPVTATASFEVKAPIVSLPAPNARAGLLAWAALAHETAGHDVLEADTGLRAELSKAVREALLAAKLGEAVAGYWSDRLEEAASDVLGVLNMGPAAAVGLVGYFRALNGAYKGRAQLRNVGSADDPHPADIVRGWLAAETVRLLSFEGAKGWADLLEAEVDRDAGQVRLAGSPVTVAAAKRSAAVMAETVVRGKLAALERHAFGEIQDWRDGDEEIVAGLREALRSGKPLAAKQAKGTYAAHVVAAAVYEAAGAWGKEPIGRPRGGNGMAGDSATGGAPAGESKAGGNAAVALRELMCRMQSLLKAMHDANPSWGPLYVAFPGDLTPLRGRPAARTRTPVGHAGAPPRERAG